MSTDELEEQIDAELADPRFKRRTHYHRKTYDAGCRGPLCQQAVSEYQYAQRTRQAGGVPPKPNARGIQRAQLAPTLRELAEDRGVLIRSN